MAWFEAEAFSATGLVAHAFSTRRGELTALLAALGLSGRPLATVRQVHGDRLVVVGGADEVRELSGVEADGLCTGSGEVALAVWTADCVPLLLLDPRLGKVAAVHSGWRGTAHRIAGKAVRTLVDAYGCRPSDLLAAIGPCAGPCCYEVDEPVLGRFREAYQDTSETFISPRGLGRAMLDLTAAVRLDLKETGIPAENVTLIGQCTICQPKWFFSYRREGRAAGRLVAVIGLREGKVCLEGEGRPGVTEAGSEP